MVKGITETDGGWWLLVGTSERWVTLFVHFDPTRVRTGEAAARSGAKGRGIPLTREEALWLSRELAGAADELT